MASKLGNINEGNSSDVVNRLSNSGLYDWHYIDIANHANDEIDLVAEIKAIVADTNYPNRTIIIRGVKNCGDDGVIKTKTANNGDAGYTSYPMGYKEKDLNIPPITHVEKSGSISAAVFFYQVIN